MIIRPPKSWARARQRQIRKACARDRASDKRQRAIFEAEYQRYLEAQRGLVKSAKIGRAIIPEA